MYWRLISPHRFGCGLTPLTHRLPLKGGVISEGGFGVDGVEVDEPGFEQCPRHGLQRLIHAPVQFDLVVQRAQDFGDGALFGGWWNWNLKLREIASGNPSNCHLTSDRVEVIQAQC